MTGFNIDYAKHCRIEFGAYAQVHEDHNNTMATRTTGAIALRPTGNQQGGFYFLSLETGRRINRNHWTELPMPKDVLDRVHTLARRSNATKSLLFLDRDGNNLDSFNEDSDSSVDRLDADFDPIIDADNLPDDDSLEGSVVINDDGENLPNNDDENIPNEDDDDDEVPVGMMEDDASNSGNEEDDASNSGNEEDNLDDDD